jgi:hypothetical protein
MSSTVEVEPLCERLPAPDELQTLAPSSVAPAPVGVRELRMRVKKAANAATHGRRHERQKKDPHYEKEDLRHHRDQNSDGAEQEEEDRQGEVPRPVASDARLAGRWSRFLGYHAVSTLRETGTLPRGISEFAGF